jgi:hypothetical protein
VLKQKLLQEWESLKGSMFFICKGISGFNETDEQELLKRGVYFNKEEEKEYHDFLTT